MHSETGITRIASSRAVDPGAATLRRNCQTDS
jgi:hypothetical protein